jgi:hypothetical protein
VGGCGGEGIRSNFLFYSFSLLIIIQVPRISISHTITP